MKITFLGTGTSQGVPIIGCSCPVCKSLHFHDNRLRSSVQIVINNKSVIIDTGPDFRYQILRERIKTLDAILITHEHRDHTAGLDDVRAFNFIQKKTIPLFAQRRVVDQLKIDYGYIFKKNNYPGLPKINTNIISHTQPFYLDKIKIQPILVKHHKLPILGYRINNFTYITDAKTIDDDEINKIKNSEILVINALQKENHILHFTLDEAIALAEKTNAKKVYLTHISHKMGLHREVEKTLPEGIKLSYDGLTISL